MPVSRWHTIAAGAGFNFLHEPGKQLAAGIQQTVSSGAAARAALDQQVAPDAHLTALNYAADLKIIGLYGKTGAY